MQGPLLKYLKTSLKYTSVTKTNFSKEGLARLHSQLLKTRQISPSVHAKYAKLSNGINVTKEIIKLCNNCKGTIEAFEDDCISKENVQTQLTVIYRKLALLIESFIETDRILQARNKFDIPPLILPSAKEYYSNEGAMTK